MLLLTAISCNFAGFKISDTQAAKASNTSWVSRQLSTAAGIPRIQVYDSDESQMPNLSAS